MKITDKDLIKKYVNGEDIEGYSLDELENNTDFMISVIDYTNDYKMYSSCSDKIKEDYKLVKYLVEKFKDNTSFAHSVAEYYLNNTKDGWERKELFIIMEKILPKEAATSYKFSNELEYYMDISEIDIELEKDPELEEKIGRGFVLFFDQYNCSDIILDYYATHLAKDIIQQNKRDFKDLLHNQYTLVDESNCPGANTLIISFLENYDSMLSSYVSQHLDVIEPVTDFVKDIKNNWETYISKDEAVRYNNMINMVHEYMYMGYSDISETSLLYYVANELGITEKLKKYDSVGYDDELEVDFDQEFFDEMMKQEIEENLKNRETYITVKKIMTDQLFSDEPSDLEALINSNKKQSDKSKKCKILKFKPKDDKKD